MSKKMYMIIALVVVVVLALPISAAMATNKGTIPGISIVSVVPGTVVTIETRNFPENLDFDVTIGPYGSYGLKGTKVTSTNSGKGGTFTVTYDIPAEFKDSARLAIRLQNATKGYYAYNWFENMLPTPAVTTVPASTTAIPGYKGFPSFTIIEVDADKSINIDAKNFPPNADVDVTMNIVGAKPSAGYKVTSLKTGEDGVFTAMFDIPKELAGVYMISINISDPKSGYYGVNWFFNKTYPVKDTPAPTAVTTEASVETPVAGTPVSGETPAAGTPAPAETPIAETTAPTTGPTVEAYTGYPGIEITSVVKGVKVTIQASNLPKNENFDVYLGDKASMTTGGVKIANLEASDTGIATATYDIPTELAELEQISVRLVSTTSGIYGYNWFYNQTYP